jgi:glycine cleavage system H lipoate-binding protein
MCTIYNLELEMFYLFYPPYKGELVNVNYKILNNIDSICDNQEKNNWIFDIKIQHL